MLIKATFISSVICQLKVTHKIRYTPHITMPFHWSTYIILLVSFAVLFINYLVFANFTPPSLPQSKPFCHDNEKFALLGFKRTFLLDCTNSKSNSAYPKVKSWHDESDHHLENATVTGDCCRWDGVKCNEETGHVIGLDISSSCLYGTFPLNSSLFSLDHLLEINLADNHFNYSEIPSDIGRLYQLTSLNLSKSGLGGRIPREISKLSSLSVLDLSYNDGLYMLSLEKLLRKLTCLSQLHLDNVHIQSPVPLFLSNQTLLKVVTLRNCSLVGKFPTSLLQFPNLEKVVLEYNLGLQGHLPDFQSISRLKHLSLSNTAFFGGLPTSLGNLGSLNVLNLSSCKFSGSIPPSLGNLTKLTYLALNENGFSGDLSSSIKNLTHLSQLAILDLSSNQFHGVIPEQICNASSLSYLDLSNNALSGKIPSCIGDTLGDSLHVLNLRYNSFGGNIPDTFSISCKLELINLSKNQLEGKLPKSLVNCSQLQVLEAEANFINDTFPSWLGSLPKLVVLILSRNNFHGRIATPVIGRDFHCLNIFDLSSNFLTGELPADYFRSWLAMKPDNPFDTSDINGRIYMSFCGSLFIKNDKYGYYGHYGVNYIEDREWFPIRVVDFSSNNFMGRIPESIADVVGLAALNLSNNHLVGCIPSSLSNIAELEVLDLSQNMLSGKIPQELTQLSSLEIFNVSHNHLVGPIPQGNEFSTFDESSYYGNLALCGHPLANPCGAPVLDSCENIDSLPSSPTEEIEEDTKFIDWLIISLGGVSGFTIGFILGIVYMVDRLHHWLIETFGKRKTNAKARRSTPRRRRN